MTACVKAASGEAQAFIDRFRSFPSVNTRVYPTAPLQSEPEIQTMNPNELATGL